MELKELTEKTLQIFDISSVGDLGAALLKCAIEKDMAKTKAFMRLINDDITKDWLQIIYQYYCADRKEKKQDFTPKCIAQLLSRLIGESAETIDLCAGSGTLTIQRWSEYPDICFELYELDENVIPYLLFNLIIRNVKARVIQGNALQQETTRIFEIRKGDIYGEIVNMQPAL